MEDNKNILVPEVLDKRRNNGGHSTKSKSPYDKRRNQFKDIIHDTMSREEVAEVLRTLYDKAKTGESIEATKLFLSYTLGNPAQALEVSSDGSNVTIPIITFN